MECKTYARHARNTWAVGTPAKKHIPEADKHSCKKCGVVASTDTTQAHTVFWRIGQGEIEADNSCLLGEISHLDALSV